VRAGLAGAIATALALAVVAAGAAKNQPSTTYVDKPGGYAIAIPKTWQLIPRSVPAVKALAAELQKKSATKPLAGYYKGIIASQPGLAGLKAYRFQAFDWPDSLNSPVPIEVSVGVVPTKTAFTAKDLPALGNEFARSFLSNKGAKVTKPKTVTLPAGKASFFQGLVPIGAGFTNGIAVYLIPRGKRVYELAFEIEGSQLSSATLFTSIAQHFKFV
jgi:hypothetical protein